MIKLLLYIFTTGIYSLSVGITVMVTERSAFAAPSLPQIKIWLRFGSGCGILVTSNIDFGVKHYIHENLTAEGRVSVICASGIAYKIGLDGGQSSSASDRRMIHSNGVDTVRYQLYQDNAYRIPWGDQGPSLVSGSGTGKISVLPVYAVIPGPQTVKAGSYTDIITVTFTY